MQVYSGLDRTKIHKINELIDALNDNNRLLEKREDLLYEEHDKFVDVQKSLALEVKRNEMLSCELSTCHETISGLKSANDDLNAKLEVANRSCVEHVVICNKCKDFNVDACVEHLTSIAKLIGEVASLNAQLKTSKNDFDKLKFARDAYTIGRHPSIKDGLGFKREAKNLTSHKAPISTKEKGKAYVHGRDMPRKNVIHHMPRRNVAHVPRNIVNEPSTIYHACNASSAICRKDKKVVARKLGAKCKGDKTCIWVSKAIVTNLVRPNKSWVPKTQA
jgi:hypothetical protein